MMATSTETRRDATETTHHETMTSTHKATATHKAAANAIGAADMGVVMAGIMGAAVFLG